MSRKKVEFCISVAIDKIKTDTHIHTHVHTHMEAWIVFPDGLFLSWKDNENRVNLGLKYLLRPYVKLYIFRQWKGPAVFI